MKDAGPDKPTADRTADPFEELFEVVAAPIFELDISEPLARGDKLREQGIADMREYLRARPELVQDFTRSARFVRANPALLATYGLSSLEELQRFFFTGLAPESHGQLIETQVAFSERRSRFTAEFQTLTMRGEQLTVLAQHSLVETGPHSARAYISLVDISERKRNEQRIAESEAQYRQLSAELEARVAARTHELAVANQGLRRYNEELERVGYITAHDLQEPLRMIGSYTQLLERSLAGRLDEKERTFMQYVVEGAERMSKMIADLLDYAKLDSKSLEMQTVDLGALCDGVVKALEPAIANSGASVAAQGLPQVRCSAANIERVLQNLIDNALKHRSTEAPRIAIGAARDGDTWVISVSDNGVGVDPASREQIFEMFRRLDRKNAVAGTGIGLAVAKRIVEKHGGRIWVEPGRPSGSTFRFSLPV